MSTVAMPAVSLLLIDDDREYAAFLDDAFADYDVVRLTHVASPALAIPLLEDEMFDVVLLGISSDERPIVDLFAAPTIAGRLPPVLVVLETWDEPSVLRALEAGAQDYLLRGESDPGMVVRAIRYAMERVRVREHLRQTGRRFRSLIENALDMIGVVDPDGIISYQSPAVERVLGVPPADLVGRNLSTLVHPDDAASVTQLLKELFADGGLVCNLEFRLRHADSSWRTIEATAQRLGDGAKPEAVFNARDVTQRKRAETLLRERDIQLQQAQKMDAIGRLAGGIAHDFSNLLTVIIGASEHLLEALGEENPLRRDAEAVKASADRAASLTRQMLLFSRQQAFAPAVLNLNEQLVGADRFLRRVIGEDIELIIECAADLGAVRADPVHIEQVMLNLAVNARDAMPGGGRLVIATRNVDVRDASEGVDLAPGPYVSVTVTDSGNGMSAETQAQAFEPFFTTKDVSKGTGLGLATVYGIIAQSRGAIKIVSELAIGTSVVFYLPRVDAIDTLPSHGHPEQIRGGDETILLVEDEDGVRELVQDVLVTAGYQVLAAGRPTVAEGICRNFDGEIRLLLSDMVMPEMSGPELAARALTLRPAMKVLFMSGYPAHPTVLGPFDSDKVLAKPFERHALLRSVRDLLDLDGPVPMRGYPS